MAKRIEWNKDHVDADDQENEFRDEYLKWSPQKKWDYLMKLAAQGIKDPKISCKRKIEWK